MKKAFFVVFMIFVLFSLNIFADEAEKEEKETITKIRDGFNADLAGKGKARWLGEGKLELIHVDVYPDVEFIPGPEDTRVMVGRLSLEKAIELRASQSVSSKRTTSWAAWTDQEGIINLFVYLSLKDTEQQIIEVIQDVNWIVDIKNFIGKNRFSPAWIVSSPKKFSHIFLGKMKEEKDFERVKAILAEIKVFSF